MGNRTIADEISRSLADQIERIELGQSLLTVKTPCQQDRKSDLVELDAAPVGISVNPEVLREAAICALGDGQIDERAERGGRITRSEQSGCAIDHVASPDEVVTALIVVTLGLPPWNRERRDEGAGEGFVLVCKQKTVAAAVEIPLVERCTLEWPQVRSCLIPLHLVSRQVLVERRSKRLEKIGDGAMLAISECEPKCKFLNLAKVQLSGQRDVSIGRVVKFPVHPEVIVKVGPAIACTHVAAGEVGKRNGRSQCHPLAALLRHQDALAAGEGDIAVVAGAADFEMWGAQNE